MDKKELRSLRAKELRVAKADDGTRTISGIVCYNSMSVDLGGFTELIAPGAFAQSIAGDVLMLRDHEPILLMGRTKSGTLKLADTADGLQFSCTLPSTTSANDLAESIERGDLDGVSFGFITDDDNWVCDKDGNTVRTILAAELIEISPCSFAAYPSNTVSVRSCPKELRSKLAKRKGNGCTCECEQCQDGDCNDCSDPDCTCDGCTCNESRSCKNADEHARMRMTLSLASLL